MKRHWLGFIVVVVASFAILGFTGVRIYQAAPPILDRVVTTDGRDVIRSGEILAGQNLWQSRGGMEMGSIWVTATTSRPTGRPIGSIARRSSSSTAGPTPSMDKPGPSWTRNGRQR